MKIVTGKFDVTLLPEERLAGLSGSMAIVRHGGDHAYRFEYAL